MSKHFYKKLEASDIRGICVLCEKNPQKSKGNNKFRAICSPCDKRLYDANRNQRIAKTKEKKLRPYRQHVKDTCEKCGFTSTYKCQFDVDHIDDYHQNNELSNLQTLCANCHRLKTHLNQDWNKRAPN